VAKPEAFLMRAALNLSVDAYRLRQSHGEEVLLEDVVLVDTSPSTESILLARERVARLGVCLARLGEKSRTILLAHRIEGKTYKDIAREHNLAVSTVEKHIAKAMLHLTTWMEDW
jgi:RNA polymerase sigma factor (sigma-70 family)